MFLLYRHIKKKRAETRALEVEKSGSVVPPTTEAPGEKPTTIVLSSQESKTQQLKTEAVKSKANPCEHQLATSHGESNRQFLKDANQPQHITAQDQQHEAVQETQESITSTQLGKKHCPICIQQKKAARTYRWKLIAGLFLPFALQSLDTTIIASALPFIASDFHELSQLNWIISAFNLTSATFIPAWGQFADIFGRHAAIQTALIIMLTGSAICAGTPTNAFPLLLFGRALQGIAASGILILCKVVLADKVSLKENAKNNSIFSLVGGLAYGFGPAIGGALTSVSWRWCFILNLPIALLGMVVTFIFLRKELLGPQTIQGVDDAGSSLENFASLRTRLGARLATVDYGGQILFLFGMGLLVLALTWGGSSYPWSDVHVLAPLVIGTVVFGGFIIWEYLMGPGRKLALRYPRKRSMLPIRLLWSRNAGILCYINFITGMAMFSIFYFIDLYFALVKGDSPGKAGLQLLYYIPGLGVGVYLAMFVCNVWPRKTWYPLAIGTLIEPTGIVLLAVALGWGRVATIYGMLALSGVGTGIRMMPGTLHGVGYFPRDIAAIVSLMSLATTVGGVFSLTLMFTIFNNKLASSGVNLRAGATSSFGGISDLTSGEQSYLRDSAERSIQIALYAMSSFLWLGFPAVSALGNVNIAKGKEEVRRDELDFNENVCKGSYLGSLLRKRKRTAEVLEQSESVAI